MRRSLPVLSAALLAGVLTAGCQAPRQQSPAEAAKVAECRAETDQAYRVRDRIADFRPDQRDTPYSAGYQSGNTARGLGDLFGRDQMQADCLRNAGVPGRTPDASTGPAFNTQGPQPR